MLHIILLILKIIGFLILGILGLLLAVLLLVLLVPVRYQVRGSYYKEPKGMAKVTWLLHILSVTASYEGELSLSIRLFGFRLFKPKPEGEMQDFDVIEDEPVTIMEVKPEEKAPKDPLLTESKAEPEQKPETEHGGETEPQKTRSVSPIKRLWKRIHYIFHNICDKLKHIKDKKNQLKAWIADKKNKKMLKLVWNQGKSMIRHILPKKAKGTVTFGFDDPYTTGQILTYASLIYPICHKQLTIQPVFDREVFEGEGSFRGRIRLGTLLVLAARLLFDKNFRSLLKKWLR